MNKTLRALQARKATLVAAMTLITSVAATANVDLTEAQTAEFGGLKAQLETTNAAIEREQLILANTAASAVVLPDDAQIGAVIDNRAADPTLGFRSFGEFAAAVRGASIRNGHMDERFAAVPSTYGNEGVGADGGFLVPPEYSTAIFNFAFMEDSFLPMTDNVEIGANSMVFPKDETTPWGTDGVRAYWQGEASAATATKPKFGAATLRLHKLMALVPLTDELLADTSALSSYLPNLLGRSIRWKTNDAILFGTGDGQPIGALMGGAAVTVAKDSGQATATVSTFNILNMIARLPPGSFPKSQWLITPDALPSIFGLTLGNYPIYLPMNSGIQGNPYGTLMGRPIMVSQHPAAFSALGDIQLHDFSYYRTITKAGGIDLQSSLHLYFDADATAFRAVFRVDGQPKIVAPITQAKGANTLSPFLQLQAR
jgi:HK97 family phage major capsid protein